MSAVFALLLAAAPPERPNLTVANDRALVALPPSILRQKEVRARLESALTTTFVVKTRDANARIEIRYDLWDDVYRVKRVDAAGRTSQQSVTAAQLEAWWRTPIDVGRRGGGSTVDVELVVLPFSAADESDARQWLSKSGGTRDPSVDSRSIVDALIGTTLSARPIVSYRWTLEARR